MRVLRAFRCTHGVLILDFCFLLFSCSTAAPPAPRYNMLQQKSSHNAYEQDEAILDQLIYHRIRSLEFDIHKGRPTSQDIPGDWYVYHAPLLGGVIGDSPCFRLSDCLKELKSFHEAMPLHEVVTVIIDVKDDFEAGHNPEDLDRRITFDLPRDRMFTPSDLMRACPSATTLQGAVTGSCSWPTIGQLRGKFIFVLTGADVRTGGTTLSVYVGQGRDTANRLAFIIPDIERADEIGAKDFAVFYNLTTSHIPLARSVFDAGFVSRVYGVNGSGDWNDAVSHNVHHIATNKINFHEDPWAVTHNSLGWPFRCLPESGLDCTGFQEADTIIGIEVNSDSMDEGDRHDHFVFAYEDVYANDAALSRIEWTAFVSAPNSHVEDHAKGCLMARASTADNAPYYAVCRFADNHPITILSRADYSGETGKVDIPLHDIVPWATIDHEAIAKESLIFLQLKVDLRSDGSTCVVGLGSQSPNETDFVPINTRSCFNHRLPLQGLAASSHGNKTVKFLFGNVHKKDPRSDLTYTRSSDFPNFNDRIGGWPEVRSGQIFDGVFPP